MHVTFTSFIRHIENRTTVELDVEHAVGRYTSVPRVGTAKASVILLKNTHTLSSDALTLTICLMNMFIKQIVRARVCVFFMCMQLDEYDATVLEDPLTDSTINMQQHAVLHA